MTGQVVLCGGNSTVQEQAKQALTKAGYAVETMRYNEPILLQARLVLFLGGAEPPKSIRGKTIPVFNWPLNAKQIKPWLAESWLETPVVTPTTPDAWVELVNRHLS